MPPNTMTLHPRPAVTHSAVRSESRCALVKVVGSDVYGPTTRRLDIATHTPKCTATSRT
jgi:hypothetical protein